MNEPTVHLSRFSEGTTMTKNDHMADLLRVIAQTVKIRQRLEREPHVVGSKEHQRRRAALAQLQISIDAIYEAVAILEGHR